MVALLGNTPGRAVIFPYRSPVGTVDDYLGTLDVASSAAFDQIRNVTLTVAPDAEQGTSYGMAALRYRQKPLLGFRAAKGHLSIFPFSPAAIEAVLERLAGFDVSKGTIRFTPAALPPDDVIRDLIRHRLGEIGS